MTDKPLKVYCAGDLGDLASVVLLEDIKSATTLLQRGISEMIIDTETDKEDCSMEDVFAYDMMASQLNNIKRLIDTCFDYGGK